jgi:hypothetical protein
MPDDPRLDPLFERWLDGDQSSEPPEELKDRLRAVAELETFLDRATTAEQPSPPPPTVGV